MSKMDIFLLDNLNNKKEEINIIKPKNYQKILQQIRKKFKNISEYYEIFIIDKNNKEIIIDNENKYKQIGDILFVRELDEDILEQSIFEMNYNKLSESKQEILDDKYNCNICSIIIKNEKPYLCYKCQKIFHEKCLKEWDKTCKSQDKELICPNCRNELPIEEWNKKLDYEDDRKDNANLLNEINEYKLNNNMNNNIAVIKDKKINELKDNSKKQNELINKYEEYIDKTIKIFKNILNEISSIHNSLKLESNKKLNNLININKDNFHNLNIDDLSKVINKELEQFKSYIMNNKKISVNQKINKRINSNLSSKKNKIIKQNNKVENIININNINYISNINLMHSINNNQKNKKANSLKTEENKNRINLKYFIKSKGKNYIFGYDFVNNNKDNIELIINGKNTKLVNEYELKEGENIITLIIKNKLINLSYMFSLCNSLKDISELQYLDVANVKNFKYMFSQCSSLSDIKPLQNWNVSNGNDFEGMFFYCSSLSDIKPLQKWNVSNGNNFSHMFYGCSSLSDVSPLQHWDVSNCNNFTNIFYKCSSLSDINPLENWNVSNVNNYEGMFYGCASLSNIKPLEKWNVSNCNNFGRMFSGCSSLSEIKPLQNWNVSNCKNFEGMFSGCSSLSDLTPLKNWNVSNSNNFSYMFRGCEKLSDIKSLQNWNVSNCKNFRDIFYGCSLLRDIKALQN